MHCGKVPATTCNGSNHLLQWFQPPAATAPMAVPTIWLEASNAMRAVRATFQHTLCQLSAQPGPPFSATCVTSDWRCKSCKAPLWQPVWRVLQQRHGNLDWLGEFEQQSNTDSEHESRTGSSHVREAKHVYGRLEHRRLKHRWLQHRQLWQAGLCVRARGRGRQRGGQGWPPRALCAAPRSPPPLRQRARQHSLACQPR